MKQHNHYHKYYYQWVTKEGFRKIPTFSAPLPPPAWHDGSRDLCSLYMEGNSADVSIILTACKHCALFSQHVDIYISARKYISLLNYTCLFGQANSMVLVWIVKDRCPLKLSSLQWMSSDGKLKVWHLLFFLHFSLRYKGLCCTYSVMDILQPCQNPWWHVITVPSEFVFYVTRYSFFPSLQFILIYLKMQEIKSIL